MERDNELDTKRTRTLTPKGAESYEQTKTEYYQNLSIVKRKLDENIILSGECDIELSALTHCKDRIEETVLEYKVLSEEFMNWLSRARTSDSDRELSCHKLIHSSVLDRKAVITGEINRKLRTILERDEDMKSRSSKKSASRNTKRTASSSILLRIKAKADAARAGLEFAEAEAEMKRSHAILEEEALKAEAELIRKRTELKTDLDLLAKRREADIAMVEFNVACDEEDSCMGSIKSFVDPNEIKERTRKYVEEQSNMQPFRYADPRLKATAEPFYSNRPDPSNNQISEFSRFLLKKELLISRFTKFDDRPETYPSWKATFRGIMEELQCTFSEESDLLVKWLGTESSRFAQSIRISNTNDPARGIRRIWERLEERFGCPEMIEASLKAKLERFPKITYKDPKKLYDLHDILSEILSIKEDTRFGNLLAYFDTSAGVNPVVCKLPQPMQGKWRDKASYHKKMQGVVFPPFTFFVNFISEAARTLNDPGFNFYQESNTTPYWKDKPKVNVSMTSVAAQPTFTKCIIHAGNHSINECKAFQQKTLEERRKLLKDKGICFKCCDSKDHLSRDCTKEITCKECKSSYHCTAMHIRNRPGLKAEGHHGGEDPKDQPTPKSLNVTSKCTEICRSGFAGKSCAKILPVYITHKDHPTRRLKVYVILDEQSNRSLGRKELFDYFNIECQREEYTLMSCSGRTVMSGRRADGLSLESLDGSTQMQLPTIIECEEIPNNRDEIPTPNIARHYDHLRDMANHLEPLDDRADILLLVGRDLLDAHHILEQHVGSSNAPFAQRLKFGWVVVGEVCLGKQHMSNTINTCKTYLLPDGRPSLMKPCPSNISVQDISYQPIESGLSFICKDADMLGTNIFLRTKDDDKPGKSVDDKTFLRLMDEEFKMDPDGNWHAPLPFRSPRKRLPNNRPLALHRARNLDRSLRADSVKKEHFVNFMQKLIDNNHAEVAPPVKNDAECWYLPVFGIYHPKKPDKIRCVFDSSARFEDTSLNDVLLSGPDLNNSLLGVLMRFRKNQVAVSADIQQMFYCFTVDEEHRDYLRFLWHKDNDITKELIDYRMRVHVFGNSPSPAVAIYGLHKAAEAAESVFGTDVTEFVTRHFYVDDGLVSLKDSSAAIDLLTRTQAALATHGNLHLHKFASNSEAVMSALRHEDLAQDLKDLDLDADHLPLQRSLGLCWDLEPDAFTFRIAAEDKPFTRRGILSTVNSIFDPLGFIAPVTVQGKIILRKFVSGSNNWDEPLPSECRVEWDNWKKSLDILHVFSIPRTYVPLSLMNCKQKELHVFADASEKAIAAVSFIRTVEDEGSSLLGFVLGKAKVAPLHGHTIPRLELCAAVLAVEIAELVTDNMDEDFDVVKFYTDSKVTLGYIHNQSRRFYIYVENRVDRIRKSTVPAQWNFVPTALNPADQGTRSLPADQLLDCNWIQGPKEFIDRNSIDGRSFVEPHPLIIPDEDKEIRQVCSASVLKTDLLSKSTLGSQRFERFSKWRRLIDAIAFLRRFVLRRSSQNKDIGLEKSVESFVEAERFVIKIVQRETYGTEIQCINRGSQLPKESAIVGLNPYVDEDGVLRVGGRLRNSDLRAAEKNPVLLPGKHHVSKLIVRWFHDRVKHQGRHFTEGAVRAAGYWITGGKRLVSSVIHSCVQCRKLRGRVEQQKMADLPADRLTPAPPFTNVGVDAFGPWSILTRRTRGGSANSKRWAILFTCLSTRAIHIEVVEEMSSSAFINALRRFVAIRGMVKIFRSDRGTNFVGALDSLRIDAVNVEDDPLRDHLYDKGIKWIFNAPHSSHMGGAWERLIGVTRKILDSMLTDVSAKHLTHDVLTTFMAEACAIVNNRPIVPVSTDADAPFVLSPSMLLTQKTEGPQGFVDGVAYDTKDLLKAEWKRVMALSDMFWIRWRKEYLNTLQSRRKWCHEAPNIQEGDVILLKDKDVCRNEWPLGRVVKAIQSDDKRVRKAEVRVMKDGKATIYTRPISELVLLVSNK